MAPIYALVLSVALLFGAATAEEAANPHKAACKRNPNPAPGSICDTYGILQRPRKPTFTTKQDNFQKCVQYCHGDAIDYCVSFAWTASTKNCTIDTDIVNDQDFRPKPHGKVLWNDFTCYTC